MAFALFVVNHNPAHHEGHEEREDDQETLFKP